MAGSTDRLGLYLAGGGSSEEFEDEVVDIDKQNNNFRKVDAATGAPSFTSASRPPAPFDGQLIWESDTGLLKRYSIFVLDWVDAVTVPTQNAIYVQETEPVGAAVGSLWFW